MDEIELLRLFRDDTPGPTRGLAPALRSPRPGRRARVPAGPG
jgi:hypothetical protein